MENQSYKKENIEIKYLSSMQRNKFLKVKNSLSELEKDVIEIKDRELKDRELKIRRKIEELCLDQLLSIDDRDKCEVKEMKKIRSIKSICYGCLIVFQNL